MGDAEMKCSGLRQKKKKKRKTVEIGLWGNQKTKYFFKIIFQNSLWS